MRYINLRFTYLLTYCMHAYKLCRLMHLFTMATVFTKLYNNEQVSTQYCVCTDVTY